MLCIVIFLQERFNDGEFYNNICEVFLSLLSLICLKKKLVSYILHKKITKMRTIFRQSLYIQDQQSHRYTTAYTALPSKYFLFNCK